MKDLNYVSQEITKGHNLSMNFEKYNSSMRDMYDTLAYIKLSMNYYTVLDMINERSSKVPGFDKLLIKLDEIIDKCIISNNDIADSDKKDIEQLRNDVINIMETITSYIDRLRIYEYVLNRVEYRFKDDELDENYYGFYLTNDLIHYIFSDKDNVRINSRIAEVIAELPMRLSKSKLYEYISQAFDLYHGALRGTVDDFVYALRTVAVTDDKLAEDNVFTEIRDICELLSKADYRNVEEAEYKNLSNALKIGAEKINDYADIYVLFARMVNDIYTIILTKSKHEYDLDEVNNAKQIIKEVRDEFSKTDKPLESELYHRFELFEGKQERILLAISKCEYATDAALNGYSKELVANGFLEKFNELSIIMKLQSGSDFVKLVNDTLRQKVAEDTYVNDSCEAFLKELDNRLTGLQTPVKRSIMSAVISQLPVFFNNTDEIQEYINLSLELCTDEAEKKAVVDVCKMIIKGNI